MLIFKNGTAQWFNETDELQSIEEMTPDGEAECFIETLSETRKGRYDDGRYRNCEFSVKLNYSSMSEVFKPAFLRLNRKWFGDIGTFAVQRIEYYDLTQTIEIWV